ncbi:hypothetical protein HYZ64_02270 [Candidatus Berkelbacteria bacterium]|nr:hypothetical protein [Candidatus Berkelbacteria bacterium]
MNKRHKRRIRVEFEVIAEITGDDAMEPEHMEPGQVALWCVTYVIDAIELAAKQAVKGDRKPTIPDGMPVDLVLSPGVVCSVTWQDLLEAEQALTNAE